MNQTPRTIDQELSLNSLITDLKKSIDASLLNLVDVPESFVENTKKAQSAFVANAEHLTDSLELSRYNPAALWFLFMTFTNAAQRVVKRLGDPIKEDGFSQELVIALAETTIQQYEQAQKHNRPPFFEFGVSKLFETAEPAVAESKLGADILLLVSGRELFGRDGIFLFWIQTKRNTNHQKSFTMSVKQANKSGLQLDSLVNNHDSSKGSEALYLLLSKANPFLTVASADRVKATHIDDSFIVDTSAIGARFQEYLTAKIAGARSVQLMDVGSLFSFLDERSEHAPYFITALSSQPKMAQTLIDTVKAHYDAKLLKPKPRRAIKDDPSSPSW